METRGRLKSIARAYGTGELLITFQTDEVRSEGIEAIDGKDLKITADIYREKRSLRANSYFHVLCQEIANATNETLTRVKNQIIADCGQWEITEHGTIFTIIMRDDIEWLDIKELHLVPSKKTKTLDNGKLYRVYGVKRGSHTYDSKEMSLIIDAAVTQARELGIPTKTDAEIEALVKAWVPKAY